MGKSIKVRDVVRAPMCSKPGERIICVTALSPYVENVHVGISIPEAQEVHFWAPTAEVIGHAD